MVNLYESVQDWLGEKLSPEKTGSKPVSDQSDHQDPPPSINLNGIKDLRQPIQAFHIINQSIVVLFKSLSFMVLLQNGSF